MLPYVISVQPSNRFRVHKGRAFWVCHDHWWDSVPQRVLNAKNIKYSNTD